MNSQFPQPPCEDRHCEFRFRNQGPRLTFPARTQTRGPTLQHEYRGHRIHLTGVERWNAELIELASGVQLPTKLVACPDESFSEFAARARKLVDAYLDAPTSSVRVLGPTRPWQTILS
jgi:hypothetical protein